MSKANKIIEMINEFVPMTHFGELNGDSVKDAFKDKLIQFGYEDIEVDAVLDFEEGNGGGVLVTFTDQDMDEVTCLFYVDPDVGPVASVISEDDAQIDIYLSPYDPPVIESSVGQCIDMTDLSWINKSVITAILVAGDVHESLSEDGTLSATGRIPDGAIKSPAAQTAVLVGSRTIKLPVIVKRSSQTEPYKRAYDKAQSLGKKLDPVTFAEKIRDILTKKTDIE